MNTINNLFNLLSELININVRITNLSNELLETLKLMKNCTSCKKDDNIDFDKLHKLINEIELNEEEQKKKKIIKKLSGKLINRDDELNRKVLCKGCKEKKIKKLMNKCGNEEMARLLYQCKLNSNGKLSKYIRWMNLEILNTWLKVVSEK